jgi:DNA helicase-2/ATP-dependent DNA helicase PcrA
VGKFERKLNKDQLEAISHKNGPLLIIAGAGTGKTTVITERIKYLIAEGFAKPEEILALTFTEKASKEMEERVDLAMPLSYGDMWIMTFHSFCDRVLRDSAVHIGLPPNYKLMTEAESIDLLRRNLFELELDYFKPLGNPNKFLDGLLKHFSRLQDETISPSEYLIWAQKLLPAQVGKESKNQKLEVEEQLEIKKWQELANAYKAYDEIKIKEGKFDFGDLITKTLELFNKRPNVLKEYQNKFKYILIDEFQDTNYAQNQLAILLSGKNANITAVGDDDQSIYRFRGASVSNMVQFRKNFKGEKVIVLGENYRSKQEILDKSYQLIQNNNPDRLEVVEKISKKLVAKCKFKMGDKEVVKLIHTNTVDDEVENIVEQIVKLKTNDGYEYGDIAVLVRANNHADPLIRELQRSGIPHQFLGPNKLFEKEEVIDLICYLKVLYNVNSSDHMYRLISSDIFDISPLDLIKITTHAKKNSMSVFEVVADIKDLKLSEHTQKQLVKILTIIEKHLKIIKKETAGYILYDYVKETGLFEYLMKHEEDIKTKNISKFFDRIKTYEHENKNAGVRAVVDYIDLLMEVGESPTVTEGDWQENNAVNILTVHSSKGLEFKVVFLINLVSQRFPSTERHEQIPIPEELIKEVLPKGDFHLQEERRLFYVGMTRAKERLYLTAADLYGDAKRSKKISPFVGEVMGEIAYSQSTTDFNKNRILYSEKAVDGSPKAVVRQKVNINFLSVSQIETFQICPLHYKMRYLLRLPTETTASISFGVSMHCAMKDFYHEIKNGSKPTEKLIIKALHDNWIGEGFMNKKHKEEFLLKGEKYLRDYFKNTYDPKVIPTAMEEKFSFRLDPSANSEQALKIAGTFDRIDILSGERVEIIDYKTGEKVPTQKDVDNDLQLGVYALAYSKIHKIDPVTIKLSLYYFEGQQKITTYRTKEQLEELETEILEIRKEMESSDFKCSNHFFCQNKCEYSMFCRNKN